MAQKPVMNKPLRVAVFSTQNHDLVYLGTAAKEDDIEWCWFEESLTVETAALAQGCDAVCCFVLDDLHEAVLTQLKACGIGCICLRSAGFDNLDIAAGHRLGMSMARAPAYSPSAVAEHAVTLLLTLIRKPCLARARLPNGDGRLEGLLGFDLNGKTVGVVGTGKIGHRFATIMLGFGCRVLAFDLYPNAALIEQGVIYTDLNTLLMQSDVVSLHCPLCAQTRHLLNDETLGLMKKTAILINTARGGLVDTQALLSCLQQRKLAGAGLDVVEQEQTLFFADHRQQGVVSPIIAHLLALPNVLITPHQAFFTHEALSNIAQATVDNLLGWQNALIPETNRLDENAACS